MSTPNWIKAIGDYFVNVLIGVDQLANAIAGGDPDETISSRIGRKKSQCVEWTWKKHPWSWSLDWMLDKVDRNHSIDAIESRFVTDTPNEDCDDHNG